MPASIGPVFGNLATCIDAVVAVNKKCAAGETTVPSLGFKQDLNIDG